MWEDRKGGRRTPVAEKQKTGQSSSLKKKKKNLSYCKNASQQVKKTPLKADSSLGMELGKEE